MSVRSCIGHPLLDIIIEIIHEAFIDFDKKIAADKRNERLKIAQQMANLWLSEDENAVLTNIGGKKKENR